MSGHLHLVPSPASVEPPQVESPTRAPVPPTATRLFDGVVVAPLGHGARLSGIAAQDLAAHHDIYRPRPTATGSAAGVLVDRIEQLGLTGRGGAHFPAAIKWRGVIANGGGGTLIANGSESEPLAAKDAALLQLRPHLVLDGLMLTAEAVGATDLVLWLHDGADATVAAVATAVSERRAAGYPEPPIRIRTAPARYVTGESSSVIRALNGGPPLPELVRVLPVISGVGGRPTLLHNIETLARVALIARTDPARYEPTSLLTVVAGGRRTVSEVDPTTTFDDAVTAVAPMVIGDFPRAALLGGYGGTWLDWADAHRLPVDQPTLKSVGLSLGAGIVAPIPGDTCPLVETARIIDYLAASSARQCGPCLFGLASVAELTWSLADCDVSRGDLKRLDRFLGEISGRGACAHPDGAVRLLQSALHVFADDVTAHRKGRCVVGRSRSVIPVPEVTM